MKTCVLRAPLCAVWLALAATTSTMSTPVIAAEPANAVQQSQAGSVLRWQANFAHAGATLRVSGPDAVTETQFGTGPVQLAIDPAIMKEGGYTFELTFLSSLPPAGLSRDVARPAPQVARMTGHFLIQGGALHSATSTPSVPETQRGGGSKRERRSNQKDQVIADDNIVQGSLCVGLDCINNEVFGFDTIRLKENNTRIKFEDTSTGAFPSTDWQLTANDSANGGANKFSVEDVTAATIPLSITGAAPSDSLFIDGVGRIGLRTATPVLDLHFNTGNTPAIRMEQNATGGFGTYTWDVAGNEANFFVRDVTGGSRLPFRIRPGAPTNSIDIATTGNVGMGVASALQPLHVRRTDGSARILVEEASSSTATRTVASFVNNGDVTLSYGSTAAPLTTWETTAGQGGYRVNIAGAATPQLTLAANGNLNITGALTQASSITLKENVAPVSGEQLLHAISTLPIYTWNYLTASKDEKHLGPTAEDFHRTFALGNNPKAIAPGDMAGVALGAIQALSAALSEKDRELTALRERMNALEALVTGTRR
jgi:hypothetical protein